MHLSPRDIDKLLLHGAGALAQKRLARAVRLNYPESVALIATVLLEFIRDGRAVSELMDLGRQILGRRQVLPGVPELVHEVQVEGTFPDGTKLVTVHHPIVAGDGNMEYALYSSFLPAPNLADFDADNDPPVAAQIQTAVGELTLNQGRAAIELQVTNLGDRPVQVGSHYHFIESNASLRFDRAAAYGKRLDIPAGTAVRFEPGETRSIRLVDIAGNRVIRGGNALADGPVSDAGKAAALARVTAGGFANQ